MIDVSGNYCAAACDFVAYEFGCDEPRDESTERLTMMLMMKRVAGGRQTEVCPT